MRGYEILVILLIAGAVAVILLLRYGLNYGADRVGDYIHNTYKRKKAWKYPQGRFRLADRYNGTLQVQTAAQAEEHRRAEASMTRAASGALNPDEWELVEDEPVRPEVRPTETEPVKEHPVRAQDEQRSAKTDTASAEQVPQAEEKSAVPEQKPAGRHLVSAAAPAGAEPEKPAVPQKSSAPIPPVSVPDELPTFDLPETIPPFQENRCCICNSELGGKHAVLFRADSGAEARIDYDCARKLNTMLKGTQRQEIAVAGKYMMSRLDAVDPKVAAYLKKYIKAAAARLKE